MSVRRVNLRHGWREPSWPGDHPRDHQATGGTLPRAPRSRGDPLLRKCLSPGLRSLSPPRGGSPGRGERRYAAGQVTNVFELAGPQGTSDSLGVAYLQLGQDAEALPCLRIAYRLAQEIARLQPNHAAHACRLAEATAKLGAVLLKHHLEHEGDEGERLLADALTQAEGLLVRDPANVGFAQVRILALAYAALGEAAWAGDAAAPLAERPRRLDQAKAHRNRAEGFLRELRPACAGNLLRADLEQMAAELAASAAGLAAPTAR